jgi:hypothetical protein
VCMYSSATERLLFHHHLGLPGILLQQNLQNVLFIKIQKLRISFYRLHTSVKRQGTCASAYEGAYLELKGLVFRKTPGEIRVVWEGY